MPDALVKCPERMVDLDLARDDCVLQVSGFTFCTSGMTVNGNPSFEDWTFACRVLGTINHRVVKPFKLWACLLLLMGESKYGETYAQAMEQTGLQYQTLANAVSTVRKYQRPDGTLDWHPNLSFEAHSIVANLPSDEREQWLEKAERESLNTDELREATRKGGKQQNTDICPACGATLELSRAAKILKVLKCGKVTH